MQGTTKDWESCAVKIAAGEHHIKKGPIASRMNTRLNKPHLKLLKVPNMNCKHHYIKKFNPKDGPKGLANAITNPMVIGKELIALIEALKLTDPGLRALVMHGAELPRQAVHIT